MGSSSGWDEMPLSERNPIAFSPLEVRKRSTVSVAACVTRIASLVAAARSSVAATSRWLGLPAIWPTVLGGT
eukprot:scaffold7351_cov28-Tisochrysis_lutea.AAC.4